MGPTKKAVFGAEVAVNSTNVKKLKKYNGRGRHINTLREPLKGVNSCFSYRRDGVKPREDMEGDDVDMTGADNNEPVIMLLYLIFFLF